MPWTVKDVERFKKGLTEAEKERWVRIANGALSSCMKKDGGDEIDCEVKAVKQANGSFSEKPADLANFSNPLRPKDHNEPMRLTLADAGGGAEYQLAFPIGAFKTGKYGEIIVTRTFAERMVTHWREGVLGKRAVYLDTDHDFGEANAWADDMRVSDEGLEIKWEFNSRGRELIADKRYRYYSAAIGFAIHVETGEEAYPVLCAVSLTNSPVMNTMPEAHLSTKTIPAHGDGAQNDPQEGNQMISFAEVLEYLKDAKDAEKGVVLKELGAADAVSQSLLLSQKVTTLEGEKETLATANADLTKRLTGLQTETLAKQKTEVITNALSEGRILPKDKEAWEKRFDANPAFTVEVLGALPKAVVLNDPIGNGGGGGEAQFSAEENAMFAKMGLDEKVVKEHGGKL